MSFCLEDIWHYYTSIQGPMFPWFLCLYGFMFPVYYIPKVLRSHVHIVSMSLWFYVPSVPYSPIPMFPFIGPSTFFEHHVPNSQMLKVYQPTIIPGPYIFRFLGFHGSLFTGSYIIRFL